MKTQFFVIAILLALLSGCGGGGSSAPTSPGGHSGGTPTPTSTNTAVITGKVIDGYVDGATVYMDLNWNLQKDPGEPSTTTDANGNFQFSTADMTAYPCYQERPIVAEVPVGAVDSTSGPVKQAYSMVYVPVPPGSINTDSGEGSTNITPFTTLFATAIASAEDSLGVSNIAVADGCGDVATAVSDEVNKRITDIQTQLFDSIGVDLTTFYQDYIAAGDQSKIQAAATLNNYFKATYELGNQFQTKFNGIYNTPSQIYMFPDADEVAQLLSGSLTQQTIPFNVKVTVTAESPDTGGWLASDYVWVQDLYLNDGQYIVDWQCAEGGTGSCDNKPVDLSSLPQTAKLYRDDKKWAKTDAATGYKSNILDLLSVAWDDAAGGYDCMDWNQFQVNNDPVKSLSSATGITQPEFSWAEYDYAANGGSLPSVCQGLTYTPGDAVDIDRVEVFPSYGQYGFWRIKVHYQLDASTMSTSEFANLATTLTYQSRDTFDSATAVQQMAQIPWSPAQISQMEAGMQSNDYFRIHVYGDGYEEVYASADDSCTLSSVAADGTLTEVSSVKNDAAAAQQMCFGDVTQWPQ